MVEQQQASASSAAAAAHPVTDGAVEIADEEPLTVLGKRRTASWLDCCYHSITSMVGAGVLGLPGVMSNLGWAGGAVALAVSLFVSWHTYALLVRMHEEQDLDAVAADTAGTSGGKAAGQPCSPSPPPPTGGGGGGWRRYDRYQDLTARVLGRRAGWWALVPFQMAVLVGICITYTVVGGEDLHAAVADWWPPGKDRPPPPPSWAFYLVFAGLQLVLSQLPSFSELGFVSLIGAVMSVGYVAIAVGLSLAATPPADVDYRPLAGVGGGGGGSGGGGGAMEKAFAVFNAITTVMFAYGGHNVSLEIQATLPHPPTVPRMMRGVHIAFVIAGVAYYATAITGFRAMGSDAGDNIILTLSNGPVWVRNVARLMVVVHVASAYQVFAHPAFESLENALGRALPRGSVGGHKVGYDAGGWLPRLVVRSAYVLACAFVACLIPFFGYLMGFVGAVAITPTTFLLPPVLWILYKKPKRFGLDWWLNASVAALAGVIGALGAVASLYLIVANAGGFKLFAV